MTNFSSASWMKLPRSAALGSASRGSSGIEPQDVPGIDRIGIADPGLDLRHREPLRARRQRRARRRRRRRHDAARLVELGLPAQPDAGMERLGLDPDERAAGCRAAAASARAPSARPRRAARGSAPAAAPSTRPGRNHGPPGRCGAPAAASPRLRRIGRLNQGSTGTCCGQLPSLRPPRMIRSAVLQPRLQRPQMARRGWRP